VPRPDGRAVAGQDVHRQPLRFMEDQSVPTPNHTVLRISVPLHRQLKRLAAVRGTTMNGLIQTLVTGAIAAGELDDETPGFAIVLDADRDFDLILHTPNGELPRMTAADAEAVARDLSEVRAGEAIRRTRTVKGGCIVVDILGQGVEIVGEVRDTARRVRATMPVATARDIGRQLAKSAAITPAAITPAAIPSAAGALAAG
jgi:hypothetical protein